MDQTLRSVSLASVAAQTPSNLKKESLLYFRPLTAPSLSLDKTLSVNSHTGILHRPSLHGTDSPILNRLTPPPIQDVVEVFLRLGGALALTASQRAIVDWARPISEITHLICTTCTGSSHPGYDLFLHQQLGLGSEVERTLIHGIGCAGGLAIVRLARNICVAEELLGRRARVLVVALEVTSTLLRTEMQSLDEEGAKGGTKPNVASTIFSDAASAMIIGSGEMGEDGKLPLINDP